MKDIFHLMDNMINKKPYKRHTLYNKKFTIKFSDSLSTIDQWDKEKKGIIDALENEKRIKKSIFTHILYLLGSRNEIWLCVVVQ